jgi:hypothetical protein
MVEQASLREQLPDIKERVEALFEKNGETHIRDVLRDVTARDSDVVTVGIRFQGDELSVQFAQTDTRVYHVWSEHRTGKRFVAGNFPLAHLTADISVNPRHLLRTRVLRSIDAFTALETRFQPSIGRILLVDDGLYTLAIFDGSHGAAAEAFLGSPEIFCKLYLPDCLSDEEAFIWNNHAHIELRQQEFRAQVLAQKRDEQLTYQWRDFMRSPLKPKTEKVFIQHFVSTLERRTVQAALVDDVTQYVLRSEQEVEDATREIQVMPLCRIVKFINLGEQARRGGKLLSYELLRTTIFKDFLYRGTYDFEKPVITESEQDPREREKKNLLRLSNALANHTLEGKWGHGDERCERFWKKGAVRYWSPVLKEAIALQISVAGSDMDRVFGFAISDDEWKAIEDMIERLYNYGAWDNNHVAQIINANVLDDTTRVLGDWARNNNQDTLDAYYLAGLPRRS